MVSGGETQLATMVVVVSAGWPGLQRVDWGFIDW